MIDRFSVKLTFILLLVIQSIGLHLFSEVKTVSAYDFSEREFETLNNIIDKQTKYANIPGTAVVLVDSEGKKYERISDGFGSAETPSFIGSTSKSITAIAILKLVDQEKLLLSDKVADYLPSLISDSYSEITIENLLTHTSGITTLSGHWDGKGQLEASDVRFSKKIGEYDYSSMNYILLGEIIEMVTGKTYEDYVKSEIFQPLGMNSTFTNLKEAQENGFHNGHQYFYPFPVQVEPEVTPDPLIPMGFIITSPNDLGKFLQMIINNGKVGETQFISEEVMKGLYTSWQDSEYGITYGFGIGESNGSRVINNSGLHHSFSSSISILPEHGIGIVVMSNINSFTYSSELNENLVGAIDQDNPSYNLSTELIIRIVIGVALIYDTVKLVKALRRWRQLGEPRKFSLNRKQQFRFFWRGTSNIILLLLISLLFEFPVWWLIRWQPDIGYGALYSVIIGVAYAILMGLVESKANKST